MLDKIKKLVRIVLKKTRLVITIIVVLIGLLAAAHGIKKAFWPDERNDQTKIETSVGIEEQQQQQPTEEKKPSATGYSVAFLVLSVVFLVVVVAAWREKRGNEDKIPWKEMFLHPVYLAIFGIPIFYALAYIMVFPYWQWFWDKQILFWGTNLGIVLYVHFKTKKVKVVPGVILLLIFCGFFFSEIKPLIVSSWIKHELKKQEERKKEAAEIRGNLEKNAPIREALEIIAECESGDGTPGSSRQFDDKGNLIINKNDNESVDMGVLQINDQANKELIAEHPELDIKKSEADNFEMGILIRKRDGDFRAWNASRKCWEPKLAELGYRARQTNYARANMVHFGPATVNYDAIKLQMDRIVGGSFKNGLQEAEGEDSSVQLASAPISRWGKIVLVPKSAKTILLESFGKKFSIREGVKTEEFSGEGKIELDAKEWEGFQFQSGESEDLQIAVKFI